MKLLGWAWALLIIAIPLNAEPETVVEDSSLVAPERALLIPRAKLGITHYFDSRQYETLSVLSQLNNLPLGLRLWGFTDLHGDQQHPDGRFHLDRFFMEYRALAPLKSDWLSKSDEFGGIAEYNDFNGPGNSLVRFGAYYQHVLPLVGRRRGSLQWRVFPFETDGRGTQVSLSYSIPLTARIGINGFADLNFITEGADLWLIEPQLNVRLSKHVAAVLEFRHNGFEQVAAGVNGTGFALGLQFSR
ncbi:MAG: hypothetical protein O3A53_02295 [Acidobacteria bacterium]|nr:hypothetical protein [Acidobacteriota bacterium]MDA1233612.1 hypothetical protein [Acidobacteriota bacterium]